MKRKLLCLFDVGHTTIPLSPFFLYDTPMRRTHPPFHYVSLFRLFQFCLLKETKSQNALTVLPLRFSPSLHLGALYYVSSVVCVQVLLLCVLFTRCGLSFWGFLCGNGRGQTSKKDGIFTALLNERGGEQQRMEPKTASCVLFCYSFLSSER